MIAKAFVGTYADRIISLEIDTEKKQFGEKCELAELPAPSYCAGADGKYLIVCSETERFMGSYGGGLVSYAILPDGGLRELSRVNAGGTVTCHVAYDAATRQLAAANYGDGSFSVCRIDADGNLQAPHIFVRHAGSGPDKSRQAGPHAHQCVFAPDGTFWVCDLGLDAVIQYELSDTSARELRRLHTPPGSGARHMALDETGEYAYALCEMGSLIAAYNLSKKGDLAPARIYMLTDTDGGATGAAALKYRGGLLLATNRFIDTLSLFYARGEELVLIDRVSCGRVPRDASFVPGAELVVAGFQDENHAMLYDISNGRLEKADGIALPKPTCFTFL